MGLFGISLQIAQKVMEKVHLLPDSREKNMLEACTLYEIGCAYSAMGDYGNAAMNHQKAIHALESIKDTSDIYYNALFSFAHSAYKVDWVSNRFMRVLAKLFAKAANVFKGKLIERHVRSEFRNNREFFYR